MNQWDSTLGIYMHPRSLGCLVFNKLWPGKTTVWWEREQTAKPFCNIICCPPKLCVSSYVMIMLMFRIQKWVAYRCLLVKCFVVHVADTHWLVAQESPWRPASLLRSQWGPWINHNRFGLRGRSFNRHNGQHAIMKSLHRCHEVALKKVNCSEKISRLATQN